MATLDLLAPAKLNLFLHVTGRRADGYHELQTLFQLLDYGDRLRFAPCEHGVISLHVRDFRQPGRQHTHRQIHGTPAAHGGAHGAHGTPTIGTHGTPTIEIQGTSTGATLMGHPLRTSHGWDTQRDDALPLENNLILRAACALARFSGCEEGAAIDLDKRLPVGGGLGGGSANAAVCLLALNELWGLGLTMDELCRIGVGLGADVPVFIRGRSAWGEGIGEILEPAALPEQAYVVVTPPCHVSTAAVFNDEDLTRNSAKIRMADFLAGRCRNDCEPVARRLYPAVDEAFAWLGRFGAARMSGTGASVFLPLADEAAGEQILAALPADWSGFVAKGIGRMAHAHEDRASPGSARASPRRELDGAGR